jgi:hypothetical protein
MMANIIKTQMKITVTKVIRDLEKNHGWNTIKEYDQILLIQHVLKVVDEILRTHKNITILK